MRSAETLKILQSIGANIRRLRTKSSVTQEQLAEMARLDRRYLQRIEKGEVNLTIDTLASLADVLGVSPASLLRPAKATSRKPGRPAKKPKA